MNLIRSLMGRRNFLVGSIASTIMLALGKFSKILHFFFRERAALASDKTDAGQVKRLKGIVVYYSATGNTGKIAKAIYQGMKSVMDCDVASVKKINPTEMSRYDVIAIGSPIWYYREAANVRLFIYNMPDMEGKLCIPFCTHGTNPERFFYSLNQVLQKKSFTIIGWRDWYGGLSNVLHMPKPYLTDGHPDEIDLQEARAFGREMADRAVKIAAGKIDLIPEIPTGSDADPLWLKNGTTVSAEGTPAGADPDASHPGMAEFSGEDPGEGGGLPPMQQSIPKIDMAKCIYPRCTACIDNCIVDAINLSLATPATSLSDPSIYINGCENCGQPLCERSCSYDALLYESPSKTKHVVDMTKCTYPKCTLCKDNCPMDSIDFSQVTPVFHNNCEACDLCWCICPEDAVSIPNMEEAHGRIAETDPNSPHFEALNKAEKEGKFRRLVALNEVGWDNIVYRNTHAPRIVLDAGNYPFSVK